ncbi:MAG: hypothetical protein SNJ55_09265 [Chloroherpetonaceae bacterium]
MQNKYVGDIGDFGKYLLLKTICQGFRLGVNWCLTRDENNSDGKFIQYLDENSRNNEYKRVDEELYGKLREIVKCQNRSVSMVKELGILPNETKFFDEIKTIPIMEWHKSSLNYLSDSDVIFYDPDNGLQTDSVKIDGKNSIKYVFFEEVKDAYNRKKSLIIYQHTARKGAIESQMKERCKQLMNTLCIPVANIFIARFCRIQSRFYLILPQKEHESSIRENLINLKNLLAQQRSDMFKIYECIEKNAELHLSLI